MRLYSKTGKGIELATRQLALLRIASFEVRLATALPA